MTQKEFYEMRNKQIREYAYSMRYYEEFNYDILKLITNKKKSGRGDNNTYNECIIMADTETSKKCNSEQNHVVAWTMSIRAFNYNIVTLYGKKPSEFIKCLNMIRESLKGFYIYIYFHNLAYDYVFLRKYLFKAFSTPIKQINTKPHYPIYIQFGNGIIFKDSLILFQKSLEKTAKDFDVEHQKSVGKWDYDKIRNQFEEFSDDELEYIEHDTLSGVECIDAMLSSINKNISSIPLTATGIPRGEVRSLGSVNNARDRFLRSCLTFEQYIKQTYVFHGGYTHANRDYIDVLIKELVEARDFSSSYPYCMLTTKMAAEKYYQVKDCYIDDILNNSDTYSYMFKLVLIKPKISNRNIMMPMLQYSKTIKCINPILDNGRILRAEYVEIYLNELDLKLFKEQYVYDRHICIEVERAYKDYLPRWFTDYIFQLFVDKTQLKDIGDGNYDPVNYAVAKAKLNSLYGLCAQKSLREDIQEDYITGEYVINSDINIEEQYEAYINRQSSILNYAWASHVTSAAMVNLFELGKCCETWIYSDTDSVYGINWDDDKVEAYNESCKQKLKDRGYGCVYFNNREYWLGIAEKDASYSEFKVMGAKRYCGRDVNSGELKITVAGVPKKKGALCLNNDINNFTKGFIFSGGITGKLTHTYLYVDEEYIDDEGNETGDSINLTSCDYLLDSIDVVSWEDLISNEINIQSYEVEE